VKKIKTYGDRMFVLRVDGMLVSCVLSLEVVNSVFRGGVVDQRLQVEDRESLQKLKREKWKWKIDDGDGRGVNSQLLFASQEQSRCEDNESGFCIVSEIGLRKIEQCS